jgi:L-alanine-DL-glutamate epimerase-like enolase superfamily enzyme
MRIENAELHFLEIPFRLAVTHGARADRTSSDSLVLHLSANGGLHGYGEGVVRDYVSGSLGVGSDFQAEAVRIATALLAPLRGRDISWAEAAAQLAALSCDLRALPILCAVESALLDLAVQEAGGDAYTVLGLSPLRSVVTYGGVLPILPLEQAGMYIEMCAGYVLTDLKVKVGTDTAYNDRMLSLCRKRLGDSCDIRVDANGAWSASDMDAQFEICRRYGVKVIEQPFPVTAENAATSARLRGEGFLLMADEGILSRDDVRSIASRGIYQVLNLRLSKNGGLSRVLMLAREAETAGLTYQLGCMVGETGILSSLGRLAASLLPRPLYVEGGYDDLLLSGNVTTESFAFGKGGKAPIIRDRGVGYRVDERKLAAFTRARRPA